VPLLSPANNHSSSSSSPNLLNPTFNGGKTPLRTSFEQDSWPGPPDEGGGERPPAFEGFRSGQGKVLAVSKGNMDRALRLMAEIEGAQ